MRSHALQERHAIAFARNPDRTERSMRIDALRRGVDEHALEFPAANHALSGEHVLDALLRRCNGRNAEALEAPLFAMTVVAVGAKVSSDLARKAPGHAHAPGIQLKSEIETSLVR